MARTRTRRAREPKKNKFGDEIIGTVGDVNFPEYDGGQVLKSPQEASTGRSDGYELEYVEVPPDDIDFDDKEARWTIYRVPLDRGVPTWGSLKSAAQTSGQKPSEVKAAFMSDDPMERAWAYEVYAANYGWGEFDQYPLVLDKKSVEDRYDVDLGGGDEEEEEEEEEDEEEEEEEEADT
jgi:hypothetical protein